MKKILEIIVLGLLLTLIAKADDIKDFEIERVFRDSILLTIGAGTNEIRKKVISEALIKKYVRGGRNGL